MKLELKQTICVPLDHDRDVLVIRKGANREDGQHVKIKVIEGDKVAETEILLKHLIELIETYVKEI